MWYAKWHKMKLRPRTENLSNAGHFGANSEAHFGAHSVGRVGLGITSSEQRPRATAVTGQGGLLYDSHSSTSHLPVALAMAVVGLADPCVRQAVWSFENGYARGDNSVAHKLAVTPAMIATGTRGRRSARAPALENY